MTTNTKVKIRNITEAPVMVEGSRLASGRTRTVLLTQGVQHRINNEFFEVVDTIKSDKGTGVAKKETSSKKDVTKTEEE